MNIFQDALMPIRNRMPKITREIETLRIVSRLKQRGLPNTAGIVETQILGWVEHKIGKKLPREARALKDFENLDGGRNCSAVRLTTGLLDIWAIRAEIPDNHIPGRAWTHEITIGGEIERPSFLTVRQLVTTQELDFTIDEAVPGFVAALAKDQQLVIDGRVVTDTPEIITDETEIADLIDTLIDPNRLYPIFVVTLPDGASDISECLIDASKLAKATIGLARVIVIPSPLTWTLTDNFQRERSVFGGAVRAYLSGFSETSDRYAHRLVVAERLQTEEEKDSCVRWMRNLAAAESKKYTRLGKDLVPFAEIKNSALGIKLETLKNTGASTSEQLEAAMVQIQALEQTIKQQEREINFYIAEHDSVDIRANEAEERNRNLTARIQFLNENFERRNQIIEEQEQIPSNWGELLRYCDDKLSGKIALSSMAKKGLKKTEFEDVAAVYRSLKWLASEARRSWLGESNTPLREVNIENGIRNSHCGTDTFDFQWNGRTLSANWHIKNGGNTRDPKRCLRIYYGWDDSSSEIVIADLPSHRDTAAS